MLRTQQGIYSIKVALLAERGVVEYDPNVWEPDKIISVSLMSTPTPALSCFCRTVSARLQRLSIPLRLVLHTTAYAGARIGALSYACIT